MTTPKKKPADTAKKPAAKSSTAKSAAVKKPAVTKSVAEKKMPAAKKPTPAKPVADKKATPAKPATSKKETPAKTTSANKPTPVTPAPAKPVNKPAPVQKPGTSKKTPDDAKAQKPSKPKDSLTAEEKARVKKLREQLAVLKADKEWSAFLKEQQAALLKLRDELVPNMQNVTRDHLRSGASNVSSSSGQHIGDAGSEAEVRDLTIRLLDKDREQLREIDDALERIRKGVYGICEISLDLIPKKRLQVRPFCRLTVKCQEEYEKKYGSYANYRARQSDQVGYANLQNDMENAISLDEDEE